MTFVEEAMEMNTEEKLILVGIQMDGNGHDLLTWVIDTVAGPGDRVVAAHVYHKSDLSLLHLTKTLDNYLAEYEILCGLKQVALAGRLLHGSSTKKVLVKEATLSNAAIVVIGVNKNASFRVSSSLAKYCAKKLPATTSLLAVHGSKVVFERRNTTPSPSPSTGLSAKRGSGGLSLPGFGVNSQAMVRPSSGLGVKKSLSSLFFPTLGLNSEAKVESSSGPVARLKRSCSSLSFPNLGRSSEPKLGPCSGSMRYSTGGLTQERKMFPHMPSVSSLPKKLPDPKPGWPLLHRAISAYSRGKGPRKKSVVQWAMSLPDRRQPSDVKKHSSLSEEGKVSSVYLNLHKELSMILESNSPRCRWFTRSELENSTSQFCSDKLIGNGGCSRVYMGHLPDGLQVAVKVTKLSEETLRDFLLEADIITTLQHECVIHLVGVNIEGDELISVYNYFSRGSLQENLHGNKAKPPLPWDMRFKIALKMADVLHYLQNKCPRPVIHRDIKSANILLSDDFMPQLSDFGLAIWAPDDSSSVTHIDVFGTFGYLAPEYFMYGKISDKIDVYSFGVVLLELLTGREPINSEIAKADESLVMWATKMLEQGDLMDFLDPSLEPNYNEDQMRRTVLAATLCIRRIAQLRPEMSQVLSLLSGEEDIESWMESYNAAKSEEDLDNQDDESCSPSSIASHLGLVLQDIDDATSIGSTEQDYHKLIDEYLQRRWSRSSSFD